MPYITTPQSKKTIEALWRLEKIILDTLDFKEVVQKICDSLLSELGYLNLGYRIIVLTLVDERKKTLKRISLSQTPEAARAQAVSKIPFHDIEIPLSADDNLLIRTIDEKIPQSTHWWPDLFRPILKDEDAVVNQRAAGIKTSLVFPIIVREKAIGALIFSMIKDESEVSEDERDLIKGFSDVVGLAVQNARLYTSLEETKKKLEVANIQLKKLDLLKDEFVSVASHELRTPMTAIKSFLWMALNKQKDNMTKDLKRYLDHAYVSTERLINLVNDMLNISRIDSGRIALKLSEVNLVSFASDICEELAPKVSEKNINLTSIKVDMPKILCDADKIHEVFINFIGNSLKFTPDGGKIWINFRQDGDMVVVEINDNGGGISKEDLSKLFTKFGRLDNSYVKVAETAGTGLGLYITKALVELHKGKVWAESEGLGRGAKFSFSLPFVGSKTAKILEESAPKETANTKELEKTKVNL